MFTTVSLSRFSVERILHLERKNVFDNFPLISVAGMYFPKNGAKSQRVISLCLEESGDSEKLSKIFFRRLIVVVVYCFCMINYIQHYQKVQYYQH